MPKLFNYHIEICEEKKHLLTLKYKYKRNRITKIIW